MPLHPVIEVVLQQLAQRPAISAGSPQQARELIAAGNEAMGQGPEMHLARDLTLPTRGGEIPARLFVPKPDPEGYLVYLHGGGWVIGSLDDYEATCRKLAQTSGCAVLVPDYRLAPEHPFPAPLEDAEDALLWAAEQAKTAFARPLPLVVAGDSAGGNLTTVALRRLGDRAPAVLQVLIYPVTDCDMTRPSYLERSEGMLITSRDMDWFFRHYAPEEAWADPDISPLRARDLSGLPPAIVTLAEYDVLLDEGAAYAEALRQAGVPVTERTLPGLTHGHIRLFNLCAPVEEELTRLGREIAQACAEAPVSAA